MVEGQELPVVGRERAGGEIDIRLVDSREASDDLLRQVAGMWGSSREGEKFEERLSWLKSRQRDLIVGFDGETLAGYTVLTPMAGVIEQKLAGKPKPIRKAVELVTSRLPRVYGVSDILVSTDYRGQGLARKLAEFGAERLSPDLLIAQTKNPAAAWVLAKVYNQRGYRTFFGDSEILPDEAKRPLSKVKKKGSKLAYRLVVGSKHFEDDLYQVPSDHLPPDVPDVSRADPSLQAAFANLIKAQREIGSKATLVKPLISFKEKQ